MTFAEIQARVINSKLLFERRHQLDPRALFVSQDIWMVMAKELGWEDPATVYSYTPSDRDFDMDVFLIGAREDFCEAGLLPYMHLRR